MSCREFYNAALKVCGDAAIPVLSFRALGEVEDAPWRESVTIQHLEYSVDIKCSTVCVGVTSSPCKRVTFPRFLAYGSE